MNILQRRFLTLAVLIGVVVVTLWHDHARSNLIASDGLLRVTFLDVGQGDAIFIETPEGVQVLVDGGPDQLVISRLSAEMPPYDRTIDLVVATHPDKDHIGGLVDVFSRYKVASILTTENRGETLVSAAYQDSIVNEGVTIWRARAGQILALSSSTKLAIYSPAADPSFLESNTSSIVLQLIHGEVEFMLTGDAPVGIEEYITGRYGEMLESEVLKLGHHGSRTSTSEIFLDMVKPDIAIVSAGSDNSYGHPHQEVLAKLTSRDIPVLSTAVHGTITLLSDGEKVWQQK